MATRRIPASLVVLLACTLFAADCADRGARTTGPGADGPPRRGGTLEVVGLSDVDHLATTSAYGWSSSMFAGMFARQLLSYPPATDFATHSRPAPDLARQLPTRGNGGLSADGLTYTLHLRPGVRWDTRPSRPLVAGDLVRAFKLLLNPVCPTGAPGYFTDTIRGMKRYGDAFAQVPPTVEDIREFVLTHEIEGVGAPDDSTVVFRLLAPASDFLNLLATPIVSAVPAEYLDYLPDGPAFRQHTVSCGPYRIVRYLPNREYLLERNPTWDASTDPNRPAYVDRMHVRLGMDAQLQQLQIEAGTADISFDSTVPTAELASLLAMGDPTVWLSPPGDGFCGGAALVINFVSPNNRGALADADVRRALALAVDRAAVVQLFGGPLVNRALHQVAPACITGFRPENDRYATPGDRGDPAAARALLARAGYPEGLALKMVSNTGSAVPPELLQASLARAGIRASLSSMPYSGVTQIVTNPEQARRGDWDLFVMDSWAPDWFGSNNGRILQNLLDGRHFGAGTFNYGGYSNPVLNAAIDRATTAPDSALAELAWSEVVRIATEDVAMVPLVQFKQAWARSRRLRGGVWSILGLNLDFATVWLADAEPAMEVRR